jgi:UDP-N-acetylmuramoylalanine--D-glutamate ligase
VGLARSGVAACHLLTELGAHVSATDAKPMEELSPSVRELGRIGVTLFVGGHPKEALYRSELVVVSPGVRSDLLLLVEARNRGIAVISEVELAWRVTEADCIAITGTNGKTTTTALTGALLEGGARPVVVGGNIGRPLSQEARSMPKHGIVVAELSSFQLETIEHFQPRVAVMLNLTPDHLDRYPSFAAYRDAKARIFVNQTSQDRAILNADDAEVAWFANKTTARTLYFSASRELIEGVFVAWNGWIMARLEGRDLAICPVVEIPLLGRHNVENVVAATACALWAGVDPTVIRRAIKEFRGVPHRLEWVRELDGVAYYNDSKATNVASALKAIESFAKPIVLIAGGLGKGQDFSKLAVGARGKVRSTILMGKDRATLKAALKGVTEVEEVESLEEALLRAQHIAKPGEVVLLSPACASFDMFRDFEQRGDVFKALVLALGERGNA